MPEAKAPVAPLNHCFWTFRAAEESAAARVAKRLAVHPPKAAKGDLAALKALGPVGPGFERETAQAVGIDQSGVEFKARQFGERENLLLR